MQRDDGGHIQRLAQKSVADPGHVRLAFDATARLMLTRIEAGEGDRLSRIAKLVIACAEHIG